MTETDFEKDRNILITYENSFKEYESEDEAVMNPNPYSSSHKISRESTAQGRGKANRLTWENSQPQSSSRENPPASLQEPQPQNSTEPRRHPSPERFRKQTASQKSNAQLRKPKRLTGNRRAIKILRESTAQGRGKANRLTWENSQPQSSSRENPPASLQEPQLQNSTEPRRHPSPERFRKQTASQKSNAQLRKPKRLTGNRRERIGKVVKAQPHMVMEFVLRVKIQIIEPTKIWVLMTAKKVDALEERLEGEMSQMKATVDDRISAMKGHVSDLHEMVKILENQNQTAASKARYPIGRNMNSEIRRRENDVEIIEERGGRPRHYSVTEYGTRLAFQKRAVTAFNLPSYSYLHITRFR
ncbi:hypothetical protein M5K25_006791 [Dendrobium thyrsiflorum]|uniref:Uncharacterized protein n=1 Tax=Dendrobium thyrsiflorum TaxID=117978 RepID=A0ABD0VC33_DENTH